MIPNKYDLTLNESTIENYLKIKINQVYKLLPTREEGKDWRTALATIIEEVVGLERILPIFEEELFHLLCKLEGLYKLQEEDDFFEYRRVIFESINILSEVVKKCQ